MDESPVKKKLEPPHYMVGRTLQAYGNPGIQFKVVSVNGQTAYGWEKSRADETWTWYKMDDLHDVRKWNLT